MGMNLILFQNQKLAYKEISIADGQKNFVATYDTINYIVVADSEDARKDADKDIPVNIAMTIRDLDNNIIACFWIFHCHPRTTI